MPPRSLSDGLLESLVDQLTERVADILERRLRLTD